MVLMLRVDARQPVPNAGRMAEVDELRDEIVGRMAAAVGSQVEARQARMGDHGGVEAEFGDWRFVGAGRGIDRPLLTLGLIELQEASRPANADKRDRLLARVDAVCADLREGSASV